MGYVEQTLAEGEVIVHRARFHWLYTAGAILWLVFLGILVIGVFMFFKMMIRKWTTEIVVTNRRLIYKLGWISRDSEEFSLSRIEEINLDQSI
ncbi:MAG TPA: PH domain-containing protein, partial [Alphaproteobacteria bacterium]|nr:PH domain-containing protein [Alphaproteobacteria bacterium]